MLPLSEKQSETAQIKAVLSYAWHFYKSLVKASEESPECYFAVIGGKICVMLSKAILRKWRLTVGLLEDDRLKIKCKCVARFKSRNVCLYKKKMKLLLIEMAGVKENKPLSNSYSQHFHQVKKNQ